MAIDTALALVSLTEAKAFLKITSADEDTIIGDIVNRASELVNSYCARVFLSKTWTHHYDGNGTTRLTLAQYPISSVASVHVDANRSFGADSAVDVSADLIIDKGPGVIRLWNNGGSFLLGNANVKVVFTAGYALASMPHDIRHAALQIAQYIYKRSYQDQRIGLQSESIKDRQYTYSEYAIPKTAKAILDAYRKYLNGDSYVDQT